MFKRPLLIALGGILTAFNAHALSAGDLAFTSFNADEDGWSMVALSTISANTTVYFSDNEWTGSAFNTGESFHQWVSGASQIDAGTVIRFLSTDKTTLSSSVGSLSRAAVSGSSNYGTANSNETIYAYLGTGAATPTTFLAAITNGSFAADGSLTNTGLVAGVSAIRLNQNTPSATPDYGQYTGQRSGLAQFGDYKSLVNNAANWAVDTTDGNYAATGANTTAFAVTAVPEPESYVLALLGLGAFVAARRRSA